MRLDVRIDEAITKPAQVRGVAVEFPVELRVPPGFGTPSRHTRGVVTIVLRGYLSGEISANVSVDVEPKWGDRG